MTILELLAVYRSLFVRMNRNGVTCEDIIYIDMVKEYNQMVQQGMKEVEIQRFLSEKHKVSASTIKKTVKRLEEDFEL